MGIAHHSIVTFRIFGDELVPSEITKLLRCAPSSAYAKGDVRIGRTTGNHYVQRTGRWSLSATDREPEDIPAQIDEILDKLTDDLAVWHQLASKYTMDFFCGVFMASSNDGLAFPPETLRRMSERCITLNLDIYDHSQD